MVEGAAGLVPVGDGAGAGAAGEAVGTAGGVVEGAPCKAGAGEGTVWDCAVVDVGDGAGVGLESTAKATPLRPGPVNKEQASSTSPKDFRTGRRD